MSLFILKARLFVCWGFKDYKQALSITSKLISQPSPHYKFFYWHAILLSEIGNLTESMIFYDIAEQRCSIRKKQKILASKAKSLLMFDKIDEALEIFEQLADPNIQNTNGIAGYFLKQNAKKTVEKLLKMKEMSRLTNDYLDMLKNKKVDKENEIYKSTLTIFNTLAIERRAITGESLSKLTRTTSQFSEDLKNPIIEPSNVSNEDKMNEMITKFKELQINIENLNKKLEIQDKIIEKTGLKDKYKIKNSLSLLKEQSPRLFLYAKTFHWTTCNIFNTYKNLGTRLISVSLEDEEKLSENILLETLKNCIKNFGSDLFGDVVDNACQLTAGAMDVSLNIIEAIPIASVIKGITKIIDFTYEKIKKARLYEKVDRINKVVRSKFDMAEELETSIGKIALRMAKLKNIHILTGKNNLSHNSKFMFKSVNKSINQIKHKFPNNIKYEESLKIIKLALQDVSIFCAFVCGNAEELISNDEKLEDQLKDMFLTDKLKYMFKEENNNGGGDTPVSVISCNSRFSFEMKKNEKKCILF